MSKRTTILVTCALWCGGCASTELARLERSAQQGNADAQWGLAVKHHRGVGAAQDTAKAFRWFSEAAERGHAGAQTILGTAYYGQTPLGVPVDHAKAALWFTRAAERGSAIAQHFLATLHHNGHGVPRDKVMAHAWARLAAMDGDKRFVKLHDETAAELSSAEMEQSKQFADELRQRVAKKRLDAAENGDAAAQYAYACRLRYGLDGKANVKEAVRWYASAGEQGHVEAQFMLAMMYDAGRQIPKDEYRAFRWFKKAAEQGHVAAQRATGMMYQRGKGIPRSYEDAAHWYAEAARQNDPYSQSELGRMHRYGQGMSRSERRAHRWFSKAHRTFTAAAEQGDSNAQAALATMYRFAEGVPQDEEKALAWCERAAEQGRAESQFYIAWQLNRKGDKNREAYAWASIAATSGHAQANSLRDEIAAKLTALELREAEQMEKEIQERVARSKAETAGPKTP